MEFYSLPFPFFNLRPPHVPLTGCALYVWKAYFHPPRITSDPSFEIDPILCPEGNFSKIKGPTDLRIPYFLRVAPQPVGPKANLRSAGAGPAATPRRIFYDLKPIPFFCSFKNPKAQWWPAVRPVRYYLISRPPCAAWRL